MIQRFKETGDSRYIYQKELNKFYFQCDMAYGNFKDLPRKIASDKVLHNKSFNINDQYQRSISSIVYKFMTKSLLSPTNRNRH